MQIMQTHQEALENEITQLRSTTTSGDDYLDGTNGSGSSSSGISRVTLERLQNEILTVVDRVKSKNETILKLKASMEDLETRASTYKKELKRLKRSNRSRS
mmetsp:Transcript_16593/g.18442  ORF Transcript_16593/g.18442 Transcript_16593/m.18442 type:complete len:101 (+) Transcript_16593:34-336(+)